MLVTKPVTSLVEPVQWAKARRVHVEDGFLVGDFEGAAAYPLLEAAQKGRALKAFIEARTDEEACRFTENWGMLYKWLEGGRQDRFPLDLFRLHQTYLATLIKLGDAIRRSQRAAVGGAIEIMGDAYARLIQRKQAWQISFMASVREPREAPWNV